VIRATTDKLYGSAYFFDDDNSACNYLMRISFYIFDIILKIKDKTNAVERVMTKQHSVATIVLE
jgi:hypothetical protein